MQFEGRDIILMTARYLPIHNDQNDISFESSLSKHSKLSQIQILYHLDLRILD